jgi:signal transduction histidine kinase/HPt (histidine-containing phosphotransfer) domain-containing protein
VEYLNMTGTGRGYRLLIVDDDETDRRLYGRLLARQAGGGCEVQQAPDGAAGLAALRAQAFDCVLLDFNLPDMNGLEFLAAAAAAGDGDGSGELACAIVLVTGQGNEAIAVEAMKRGVQDYLVKDQVNATSLWRAMTSAVTQTELRQRLAGSLRELTAANAALEQEVATRKTAEAELRTAKEAAEQANRAKTRFVAMVTHELRTPLNGILGYAELLRIEGGLTEQQDARVGAMMQAGQHLLGMIERVLDFATIETGRMELHPAAVAVRELTEECMACIGPMAADHELNLRMVSAYDAPSRIVADAARLRQVLLNLLGNAVKYTAVGSIELRVLAGAAPGGLRIEVADTGPGIDEATRGRLFQEFERLGAATSVEGAGLGLAISARTIALMGGEIGYLANPGGGSVFWLELPPATIAAAPPPAAPQAAPPEPTGKRILLADDIAMNRDVIGAFLRAAGHEVVAVDSGQEAVRLAADQIFNVILMDLRMPGMDGLEATRRIRALPAPRGWTPVLALTAYTFPEQVAECREAGMDGHIAKPVEYATLVRAIADAIAGVSSGWTSHSPAPPPAEAETAPPTGFDRAVYGQMLAFLPPGEIAANLQLLRAQEQQLLELLDRPAAPEVLAETAHTLASAAGMFGFAALSTVSRSFQRALMLETPDADALARQMRDETHAGLAALDELMREDLMQPV